MFYWQRENCLHITSQLIAKMGKGKDKNHRVRRKKMEAEKYDSASGYFSAPPEGSAVSGSGAFLRRPSGEIGGDSYEQCHIKRLPNAVSVYAYYLSIIIAQATA